ncbi:MAG: hypothetical protein JNL70_09340 [Saprospiraceae bacterium]|nr:hypothetical protein [Saprospiraceae bacterium]
MEVQLIQTYIPIVHTGIDKSVSTEVIVFLRKRWWIIALGVALVGGLLFWFKRKPKKKNVEIEKPVAPPIPNDNTESAKNLTVPQFTLKAEN